jgi:cytochrome b6-f complex iron-sulfur subunit
MELVVALARGRRSRAVSVRAKPGERERATLLGRRDFIGRGIVWSLGAAIAGGIAASVRTLWPRAGRRDTVRLSAGSPEEYAVGTVDDRLVAEHWIWVIRDEDGFYALSARCTHLGCKLRRAAVDDVPFRCMCHGSTFAVDGSVLRGPAARALERVRIVLSRQGTLLVDPSVTYRKERGEWDQPGAFVPVKARNTTSRSARPSRRRAGKAHRRTNTALFRASATPPSRRERRPEHRAILEQATSSRKPQGHRL